VERAEQRASKGPQQQQQQQQAVEEVFMFEERLAWDAAVEAELSAAALAERSAYVDVAPPPPTSSLRTAASLMLRHAALVLSGLVALVALLCMGYISSKVSDPTGWGETGQPRRATPPPTKHIYLTPNTGRWRS